MNSVLFIRIVLVIFILLFLWFSFILYKAFQMEKRIARYSLNMNAIDEESIFDKLAIKYNNFLNKFTQNKMLEKHSSKYTKYITIGEEKNTSIFLVQKLLIACLLVILVIISYTVQGKSISFFGFLFCFILGYYLYDIYLIYSYKRRRKKIKNDMLRAIIIMNNAFKAGKSTLQAVEIASLDLPKPINYEFFKIYQDMSYGLSSDVAFGRFAKRVNLEEATYISSSLTILNKTGGNIIMVFSSIERTLFDKKKLESDLKNSTAASNLIVKVLIGIPILFVLVIYAISPSYFDPLFSCPLGYMTVGMIGLMFIVYIYLLNKIMKVKV